MRAVAGTVIILAALPASAGAEPFRACTIPRGVAPAPATPPPAREIVRDAKTASYMLALTWSPEWCRTHRRAAGSAGQCERNHFGFVVHGLWPNGRGGRHPRYCAPAPPLSPTTLRASYCMTPSPQLLQREWAAHGTCGWATSEAYFAKARALWADIRAPDVSGAATAGDVRRAFVRANHALRADGVYVKVASGNRLEDVRLCYDLSFKPAACIGGVGAPDSARIRVTH